ncbi:GNAT family N-acetyltransferase [Mycolicibacterium thermoresistibile]
MIIDLVPRRAGGVVVRRLDHHDAEAFAAGTKDTAVRQYGHLPLPEYTPQIVREQIDGVIAAGLADGSLAVLAIADASSNEFLGSIVLFDVRGDRAEVGFWLSPQARGRGAALTSLHIVADLASDAGLTHLDARTHPANDASRHVLQHAGFVQVGGPEDQITPAGELVPVLTFERRLAGR